MTRSPSASVMWLRAGLLLEAGRGSGIGTVSLFLGRPWPGRRAEVVSRTGGRWPSAVSAAAALGVSRQAVNQACARGRRLRYYAWPEWMP